MRKAPIIIIGIWLALVITNHYINPNASAEGNANTKAISYLLRNYNASIIYYDIKHKLITIHIDDESLICGTDGCCDAAAQLFYAILSVDKELILLVEAEFVPSAVNPMDYAWAKYLAEDNGPFHPFGNESYQLHMLNKVSERTKRWT